MYRTILLAVMVSVMCGCQYQNLGRIREPVAALPNGDEVYVIYGWAKDGQPKGGSVAAAVWKTSGGGEKQLVTLIPSPTSPGSMSGGLMQKATVWISPAGTRVCVIRSGQVFASFDLERDLSVLGPYGQPDWTSECISGRREP